jgi:NAD(P)-dependent dehydrogenase (short-subunit alcohol dehydrogenase family)
MRLKLFGQSGGIGSTIKELAGHEFVEDGEIDWLIFAQGILDEMRVKDTFDTNTLLCIETTLKLLPRIKVGVVYISSTSGIKGNTKFPIYSASKAALNSYAETMARKHPELQFYALCPGPTDTKMWRSLELEGNPQKPEEVAKAVVRIMEGEFKSGSIITVRDGVVSV